MNALKPRLARSLRHGASWWFACAVLWLLVPTGCSIADSERCTPGFNWDDEYRVCTEVVMPSASGGAGGAGPGGAGGDSSAESEVVLGEACDGPSHCENALEATYCLKSPFTPDDPGLCTIPDCTETVCGPDYVCCDCAAQAQLGWPAPLCAPADRETQLVAAGCVCD